MSMFAALRAAALAEGPGLEVVCLRAAEPSVVPGLDAEDAAQAIAVAQAEALRAIDRRAAELEIWDEPARRAVAQWFGAEAARAPLGAAMPVLRETVAALTPEQFARGGDGLGWVEPGDPPTIRLGAAWAEAALLGRESRAGGLVHAACAIAAAASGRVADGRIAYGARAARRLARADRNAALRSFDNMAFYVEESLPEVVFDAPEPPDEPGPPPPRVEARIVDIDGAGPFAYVTVALRNQGPGEAALDPWNLCRDGLLEAPVFRVRDASGADLPYAGRLHRRPAPDFARFAPLAEGAERRVICLLNSGFELDPAAGPFEIVYDAVNLTGTGAFPLRSPPARFALAAE